MPGKDPSALEKSNQRERIALSTTFKRQLKPLRLLTYLVECNILKIETNEEQIGIAVFDKPVDWVPLLDSAVREGTRRLRNLLEAYYASEGIEDRVSIDVAGSKIEFSYNLKHPVERNFQRALRHLATEPRVAFSMLDAVHKLEPEHAEAFAAWGEAELWRPMYGNLRDTSGHVKVAESQAKVALEHDKNCWRAQVVFGAAQCCRMEWRKAASSFEAALQNSREDTQAHPWYAAFLMAVGRTEEALMLTKARAYIPSDAPWPLLTYAAFLYAARQFEEAKQVISDAKRDYDETWLSHVLWSCVLSGMGRDKSTVPLLGMSVPQYLPNGTEVYTALSIFENLRAFGSDNAEFASVKEAFSQWIEEKTKALDATSDDETFWAYAGPPVARFQIAIACIATGDNKKAVELLTQDFEQGQPLLIWLHLWPLFDPLRNMPEFKRLVRRMKLPKAKR